MGGLELNSNWLSCGNVHPYHYLHNTSHHQRIHSPGNKRRHGALQTDWLAFLLCLPHPRLTSLQMTPEAARGVFRLFLVFTSLPLILSGRDQDKRKGWEWARRQGSDLHASIEHSQTLSSQDFTLFHKRRLNWVQKPHSFLGPSIYSSLKLPHLFLHLDCSVWPCSRFFRWFSLTCLSEIFVCP